MKTVMIFILLTYIGFSQDTNAQDADRHQYNPYNSSISPQGSTDNYNPFFNWSGSSVKSKAKYWKANVEDILGKWKYINPPNFAIEFSSDSSGKTFHIYDEIVDYKVSGSWSDSYDKDILMITLKYFEYDGYEKLAIKRINKRKLALGANVNGEFVPKVHIKKQK